VVVGVTGGIGSGKSIVCGLFARLGRTVLSADPIAKEILDADPGVGKAIRKAFGADVYTADGKVSRSVLASRVFGDPHAVATINTIVHPRVFEVLAERIAALPEEKRKPYVIVEAALVYESGLDARIDRVILVEAPLEQRLLRVLERDGIARDEILRRAQAQIDPAVAAGKAHFVIKNDGAPELLSGTVTFLDALLRAI
jgi:dephospho-CoA kinase